MLLETTFTGGSLQGSLDAARSHGERGGGGVQVSPVGWKEIERMAVGAPVLAEQGEGVRQRGTKRSLPPLASWICSSMRALSIWGMRRKTPSVRRKPAA